MPYTNGSMDATNHMKTWGHCACYHVNLLQMKLPRESKNLFRFRKYVWMLCWRVQKWLESRKYYKCSHELWNPYEFTFSMHLLCTKLQSQCELYIIWSTDIVICMLPSHTDTHTHWQTDSATALRVSGQIVGIMPFMWYMGSRLLRSCDMRAKCYDPILLL